MTSHEKLVEDANEAINRVFGDTSVSKDKTEGSLEELVDNIKAMLETI